MRKFVTFAMNISVSGEIVRIGLFVFSHSHSLPLFLLEKFRNDVKIFGTLAILIVVMTVSICLTFTAAILAFFIRLIISPLNFFIDSDTFP